MTTTTQRTVVDLMVEKFAALLPIAGLTPAAAELEVFDGDPDGSTWPDNFVTVMGDETGEGDTGGQYELAYLGTTSFYERYRVHVGVFSLIGGSAPANVTPVSGSDAQAVARANADVIHEALGNAMKADRNLRIQNGGLTAPVIQILLSSAKFSEQTFGDEGAMGRYATWHDTYSVLNVVT